MTQPPRRSPSGRPLVGAPEPSWTTLRRTRTRPTRRSLLNGFLGLLLYGAGANVNAGFVVILASLLLGTIPFAWFTARRAAAAAQVRRRLPRHVTAHATVASEVEVRVPSFATVVVRDELTTSVGAAARPVDGVPLSTDATLPRGHLAGGTVEVFVSDVFGLVESRAEAVVPAECEVLPGVPVIRGAALDAPWAIEVGEEVAREGSGPEVLGVREYRHGDPVRTIHWRSSARRSQLVVRELADEALPGVRIDIAAGTWDRAGLDRATEVACGLAEDVRRDGYPVEIGVDGSVLAWGPSARRNLAFVPPHAGADARALAPAPDSRSRIRVHLAPAGDGVSVTVSAAGASRDLGIVPSDLPFDAIGGWFSYHRAGG